MLGPRGTLGRVLFDTCTHVYVSHEAAEHKPQQVSQCLLKHGGALCTVVLQFNIPCQSLLLCIYMLLVQMVLY